jgi:hypothetical protein
VSDGPVDTVGYYDLNAERFEADTGELEPRPFDMNRKRFPDTASM